MKKSGYTAIKVVDTATLTREEWLNLRKNGLGGSDAPIVMNVSMFRTLTNLYHDKVGTKPLIQDEEDQNSDFRLMFGTYMENFVGAWFESVFEKQYKADFEKHFGELIKSVSLFDDTMMYQHPEYPFMLCNNDFIITIEFESGDKVTGVFECKTTSPFAIKSAWSDGAPSHYIPQARHAMAVMNMDFTVFACAADNSVSNFYVHILNRDYEEEETLINAESSFWNDNVLAKKAPVDNSNERMPDAFYRDLMKYNAGTMPKKAREVKFPAKTAAIFTQYCQIEMDIASYKNQIKQSEKDLLVLTNKLIEALGKGSSGYYCDGSVRYFIEKIEKASTTFNRKQFEKDRPNLAGKYLETSKKLVFSVGTEEIVQSESDAA